MVKEYKELLRENNKREKMISKSNVDVYTNMIVYLQGSDIDEYNQQLVRADLIEMIIDGQERNDDIEKVMGGNYREICDEIIKTFPLKTTKQKLIENLGVSLSAIWILLSIFVIQSIMTSFIQNNKVYSYELSIGDLLSIILIAVVSNIIVKYLCKNAFDNSNKNKKIEGLKLWLGTTTIIGSCVALSYYLDYVIMTVPVIVAIGFIAIVFCLEKILNSKIYI